MTADLMLRKIEEALELEADSLYPEMDISEIPDWSSLTFLSIISLCDEIFGVNLLIDDLMNCIILNDIYDVCVKKSMLKNQ